VTLASLTLPEILDGRVANAGPLVCRHLPVAHIPAVFVITFEERLLGQYPLHQLVELADHCWSRGAKATLRLGHIAGPAQGPKVVEVRGVARNVVDVRGRLTADLAHTVIAAKHCLAGLWSQLPLGFVVPAAQDVGNAHLDRIPDERIFDPTVAIYAAAVVDELENLAAFVGTVDTRVACQANCLLAFDAMHRQSRRHALVLARSVVGLSIWLRPSRSEP